MTSEEEKPLARQEGLVAPDVEMTPKHHVLQERAGSIGSDAFF